TLAPELPISPRDRVLVEGTVVPNLGLSLERLTFTFLERDVVLEPIQAQSRLREFAELKGQLVTLEGTLDRRSSTDPNHLILDLVAEGVRVHVYHATPNPSAIELPDGAILRLTGVYNPKHDGQTDALELDL